jgi:hypothetical protein
MVSKRTSAADGAATPDLHIIPSPADEYSSLEAYRGAYFRALLADDLKRVEQIGHLVERAPWPTLHEAAQNLARECRLAVAS